MLGFFLGEIPRKRGSKTSKLFFFFLHFRFFFIFNVFAPLRTFDDFVALKRVFFCRPHVDTAHDREVFRSNDTHSHTHTNTHARTLTECYLISSMETSR